MRLQVLKNRLAGIFGDAYNMVGPVDAGLCASQVFFYFGRLVFALDKEIEIMDGEHHFGVPVPWLVAGVLYGAVPGIEGAQVALEKTMGFFLYDMPLPAPEK
jgi:hypothetical protein